MTAIIALFIQFLPDLVKAAQSIPSLIGFIQRTEKTLKQETEWTPEIQAAFDQRVEVITSQPHWKIDPDPTPVPPGK